MSVNKKYHDFGGQLKKIRLDANKSIDDVSGAVELSVDQLKRIELGEVRPEEEMVFLLAGYFRLSFARTQQLLRLAGYSKKLAGRAKELNAFLGGTFSRRSSEPQQIVVAISEFGSDRAVYINETSVNVSHSGVVIEFLQSAAISRDNQAKTIAKIGMSVEHAYQLRDILQHALANLKRQREPD